MVGQSKDGTVGISLDSLKMGLSSSAFGKMTAVDDSAEVSLGSAVDTVIERQNRGVRVTSVIKDSSAPESYDYTMTDGAHFIDLGNGIIGVSAGNNIVGTVAPAWAVDATGKAVPTKYELQGGRLIQRVEHSGAAYPVVADPSISFGWYIYVRYSKAEVQDISYNATYYGNQAALLVMCWYVGLVSPPLGIACAVLGEGYLTSVMENMKAAKENNQCVEHRYTYNQILVGWTRYNC